MKQTKLESNLLAFETSLAELIGQRLKKAGLKDTTINIAIHIDVTVDIERTNTNHREYALSQSFINEI